VRCFEEAWEKEAKERTSEDEGSPPAPRQLTCCTAVLSPALLRCGDVTHPPFGGGLAPPKRAPPWLRRLCLRLNDAIVDVGLAALPTTLFGSQDSHTQLMTASMVHVVTNLTPGSEHPARRSPSARSSTASGASCSGAVQFETRKLESAWFQPLRT
jgi:hypothetical protein